MTGSDRTANVHSWWPTRHQVVGLGAAVSSAWLAGWWMSGHGMRLEVVPALSMLALRHFKHARDPEAREPMNPAVKFLINAWDTGDLSEAETFIAPDCAVKMNGLAFEPDATNDSVSALRQSIETWRGLFPDLDMTLTRGRRGGRQPTNIASLNRRLAGRRRIHPGGSRNHELGRLGHPTSVNRSSKRVQPHVHLNEVELPADYRTDRARPVRCSY